MNIFNLSNSPSYYVNFATKKGDSFSKSFEYLNEDDTPFDFTGYTAKMEVRKKEGSEVVEVFDTEDGSIALAEGEILLIKDEITGAAGDYLCDFQLVFEDSKSTLFTGNFKIYPDITE